jgi:hypothetical protein
MDLAKVLLLRQKNLTRERLQLRRELGGGGGESGLKMSIGSTVVSHALAAFVYFSSFLFISRHRLDSRTRRFNYLIRPPQHPASARIEKQKIKKKSKSSGLHSMLSSVQNPIGKTDTHKGQQHRHNVCLDYKRIALI